jgi:hypothetical protein
MEMAVVVPVMGRIHETKGVWGALLQSVQGSETDLYIVENSGPGKDRDEMLKFSERFLAPRWPGKIHIHHSASNLGMILSLQHVYDNTDYDILAYLHNDLYIYGKWVPVVKNLFEHETTGLVGFFGAEHVVADGHRGYVWSNMLEAEIHGDRFTHPPSDFKEVAVLDGMAMICGRKMLDAKGGLDTDYDAHHFYDLDLSLESIDRGFSNYVIPTPIHHRSGLTACSPLFHDWANKHIDGGERALYEKNKQRFMNKWQNRLPYQVGVGWNA